MVTDVNRVAGHEISPDVPKTGTRGITSQAQHKDRRRKMSSLILTMFLLHKSSPHSPACHMAFSSCALCASRWKLTRPYVTRMQVSDSRVSEWEKCSVRAQQIEVQTLPSHGQPLRGPVTLSSCVCYERTNIHLMCKTHRHSTNAHF